MPAPSAPIRVGVPPPYVTSHGARVARLHMYDWIVLVLLVVVDGVLNKIEPFHRFVGSDMMTDLRYPMKDNTVPFWSVPIYAIIVPMIIMTGIYFKRRNVYDLHHATLGLLFSMVITAVVTDAIKDGVGRPRPDFFWRCFPDGVPVMWPMTTLLRASYVMVKRVISEKVTRVSQVVTLLAAGVFTCYQFMRWTTHKFFCFSVSFAGLGFLSWYLAGKIKVFDRRGHVAKLCIIFLPLLVASLVAVSRVDDYRHHWQDVCTGGILGLVVASLCYLQFFPLPCDENGLWPHAYIRHVHNLEGGHTSVTHGDGSPKLGAERFV